MRSVAAATGQADRNSLDALTGLRFVAAVAVVFEHAQLAYAIPDSGWPLGSLAVGFFFVLSGFILAYAYDGRLSNWSDCHKFWVTRFARVWPISALTMVLAIFLIRAPNLITHSPEGWLRFWTSLTCTQAWIPTTTVGYGLNPVSWSISCEAFFYLLFPLLYMGGWRRFLPRFVLLLVAYVAVLAWVFRAESQALLPTWVEFEMVLHCNPAMRLTEFALGILAGYVYLWRRRVTPSPGRSSHETARSLFTWTVLELAVVILLPLLWHWSLARILSGVPEQIRDLQSFKAWDQFTSFSPVFVAIIYLFAWSRGLMARWLSSRPMVYLGEISFSLYMIHYIILMYLNNEFLNTSLLDSPWLAVSVILALSITASIYLYHVVELPAKQWVMQCYRGQYGSATITWVTQIFQQGWRPRVFLPFAFAFMMSATAVYAPRPWDPVAGPSLEQLLAVEGTHRVDANFNGKVRLHGYRFELVDEHIQLTTIWTASETQKNLAYFLCDRQGNSLRRIFVPTRSRSVSWHGRPFERTIRLQPEDLREVASIGVSLDTRLTGTARLNTEVQRLPHHRFALVVPLEWNQLPEIREFLEHGDHYWEQPVQFGSHSQLVAYRWQEQPEGMVLQLLWNRQQEVDSYLFGHFCDFQGNHTRDIQDALPAGKIPADDFYHVRELRFRHEDLQRVASIGLGFFDREIGMESVLGGHRALEERRLQVPLPEKSIRASLASFIRENAVAEQPVEFGTSARLLALKSRWTENGLRLESVWERTGPMEHQRFAHLCDGQGNILRHAQQQRTARTLESGYSLYYDVLEIPRQHLQDVASLGFGFYSKEKGTLPVSSGSRSMNGSRLDLRLREMPGLAQESPTDAMDRVQQVSFESSGPDSQGIR